MEEDPIAAPDAVRNMYPGGETGPPAPGADRQLVLFCWLHTALTPGCERHVAFDAGQLDGGNGIKPLVKKLKRRGLAVEIAFEDAAPKVEEDVVPSAAAAPAAADAPAADAAGARAPPPLTHAASAPPGAPARAPAPARSAALERAQAANASSRALAAAAAAGVAAQAVASRVAPPAVQLLGGGGLAPPPMVRGPSLDDADDELSSRSDAAPPPPADALTGAHDWLAADAEAPGPAA